MSSIYGKRRIGCAGWIFIIIASIFALVLAITLISLAIDKQKDKQREEQRVLQAAAELTVAEAYDESMAQLRDEGYVCPETADKAVSVYISEAEYLTEEEKNHSSCNRCCFGGRNYIWIVIL